MVTAIVHAAHQSYEHSWLEFDGWAVDASNGIMQPVLIMTAREYRAANPLTAQGTVGLALVRRHSTMRASRCLGTPP
jgi:hypothetical protein